MQKNPTALLLCLYQIFIFLLNHHYFFLHFFLTFLENHFKKHSLTVEHTTQVSYWTKPQPFSIQAQWCRIPMSEKQENMMTAMRRDLMGGSSHCSLSLWNAIDSRNSAQSRTLRVTWPGWTVSENKLASWIQRGHVWFASHDIFPALLVLNQQQSLD